MVVVEKVRRGRAERVGGQARVGGSRVLCGRAATTVDTLESHTSPGSTLDHFFFRIPWSGWSCARCQKPGQVVGR